MNPLLFAGTNQGVVVAGRQDGAWQVQSRSLETHQVHSLSVGGDTILAGTRQGIYRSGNLGRTWQPANEGLTELYVRWLAHHPDGSGTVLAGTEPAALYLSRDGGQTWAERPEVAQLRDEYGWYLPYSPEAGCVRGFSFAAGGDRVYAAVEVGGLLRSDDRGETWRLVGGSSGDPRTMHEGHIHPDVHSVVVHPSSPDLVFAPTGGGFFSSKDGGQAWEQRYQCYVRAVWVDLKEASHMVLGPADSVNRNGRIEQTRAGGSHWEQASKGLDVPWPRSMVERFRQEGDDLFAVLAHGELLAAPLETLAWQRILAKVEGVRALAFMDLE